MSEIKEKMPKCWCCHRVADEEELKKWIGGKIVSLPFYDKILNNFYCGCKGWE
jgi:hypothetical protein